MLVLTLFACFGKQVSLQSPIKSMNIEWQNPVVVTPAPVAVTPETTNQEVTQWEAVSGFSTRNLYIAQQDCRQELVNQWMLDNDKCKTVGNTTKCSASLSGFRVEYKIVGDKVVCKKA